jgi:predicted kinase
MKLLFLLRGLPGAGKSTFIKQNNLTNFTLDLDEISSKYLVPLTDPSVLFDEKKMKKFKRFVYNQFKNYLLNCIEKRMQNNELIIIDGVHIKPGKIEIYLDLLNKYKYDFYCIDFSDIPIEKCKLQNKMRVRSKWISEEKIDRMYKQLQEQVLPNNLNVITRNEFLTLFSFLKKD